VLREAESLWRRRPLADLEFERFARIDIVWRSCGSKQSSSGSGAPGSPGSRTVVRRRLRGSTPEIASDAVSAFGGPERLWPNAPEHLEGDADVPYRNV
jgi:hypothetical protein